MRDLKRNQRGFYYARFAGTQMVIDDYGNETLEEQAVFDSPVLVRANVSANVGQEAVEVFGAQTDYSRTVSLTGNCPLSEGDRVWFGVDPEKGDDHNYVVVRVADSKNGYLVALREVTRRG